MATFILSAAIRAVKSKAGTWRAYDSISGLVPEVTRGQWAAAIGEARSALAQRVSEAVRPLNRRPTASEFGPPLERKSGTKFWQTVEIYARDRETGARSVFHYTHKTDTLRSRMVAVKAGIEKIQGIIDSNPTEYPLDIVGFAYTGTYPIVSTRKR